jgi:hypothetical protein
MVSHKLRRDCIERTLAGVVVLKDAIIVVLQPRSMVWIAAEDVDSAGATLAVEAGALEVREHGDGDRLYEDEG